MLSALSSDLITGQGIPGIDVATVGAKKADRASCWGAYGGRATARRDALSLGNTVAHLLRPARPSTSSATLLQTERSPGGGGAALPHVAEAPHAHKQ